ncbi:MAG: ribosome biogenesis GTPase YlqF, partial [Ruminococcaceae bacterium]|nr:ribosome biogenesis GTPase YlqF [Oscillospiraceae bacterium]
MQLDNLSWFPGHMTKTRRMIASELSNMDAVCEIVDARIPSSSRNPDVDELTAGKPRIIVLNRVDQADPELTKRWSAWFRGRGFAVVEADSRSGAGVRQFASAVRELLRDKIAAYEAKGQVGRVLRVMVLGIPNVGKSTFINKVSGRKSA